jgi:predicted metalloprotease
VRATVITIATLVGLLTTACGVSDDSLAIGGSGSGTDGTQPIEPPSTTAPPTTQDPLDDDERLEAVAADVEDYWSETLDDVYGTEYEPLDPDRIVPATSDDTDLPTCDGVEITYEDVEGNAFAAPCPEGIVIMWDNEELIPELDDRFGPVASAVVVAHEWGHVAQFQAGVEASDVIIEQQADCFAGAWLADLLESPGSLDGLAEANPLDSSLSSVIAFRDAVGSSPTDPGAHGAGFDRVRAFQEGFDRGAEYCSGYPDNPPPLVQMPFEIGSEDEKRGGDLPLDELVTLVVDDLNVFFEDRVDGFEGASAEDVLAEDETAELLEDLHGRIGDNAAGLVLGLIWSEFAQDAAGADKDRDEEGQFLQQACLTGGWMASVFLEGGQAQGRDLTLSPGDLDEALLALIDLGGASEDVEDGAVFELVASLRQGVVDGFDSCGLES